MQLGWKRKKKETSKGEKAESFAATFLKRQGLVITDRNYRSRYGEVDIIATLDELLVFIEVRLRNHHQFATGSESVDIRKQQKLVLTAQAYLQQHYGNNHPPCRFDVVSLASQSPNQGEYRVEWLQDAFRPEM